MAFGVDRLLVAGLLAAGGFFGCVGNAAAQPPPDPDGFTFFSLPSGNVGCVIHAAEDYVRCDIQQRSWAPPPRGPTDCAPDPGSYGGGVELTAGESPKFTCARDTAMGGGPLAYGDTVTVGRLSCESAQTGMSCRDVDTGRGFVISRESYRFF